MTETLKAIASAALTSFKDQPILLALVILNCLVFGVVTYGGVLRSEREKLILEACLPKRS